MNHWLISIALEKLAEFWRPSLPDSVIVKSTVQLPTLQVIFIKRKKFILRVPDEPKDVVSYLVVCRKNKQNCGKSRIPQVCENIQVFPLLLKTFLHFTLANFNINLSIHS